MDSMQTLLKIQFKFHNVLMLMNLILVWLFNFIIQSSLLNFQKLFKLLSTYFHKTLLFLILMLLIMNSY